MAVPGLLVPFGEERALSEKELLWGFDALEWCLGHYFSCDISWRTAAALQRSCLRDSCSISTFGGNGWQHVTVLAAGVLTINTDNLVVFSNTIANILLTGENKTLGAAILSDAQVGRVFTSG